MPLATVAEYLAGIERRAVVAACVAEFVGAAVDCDCRSVVTRSVGHAAAGGGGRCRSNGRRGQVRRGP